MSTTTLTDAPASLLGGTAARRSVEPGCARCGYPTRGLASLHCPECGSDLREIGIRPPGRRGAAKGLAAVALRTLVVGLPALVLTALLNWMFTQHHAQGTTYWTPERFAGAWVRPPPGTLEEIDVSFQGSIVRVGSIYPGEVPADRIVFVPHVAGRRAPTLEVNAAEHRARYEPQRGTVHSGDLSATFVAGWVQDAGMDPQTPTSAQLIDDVLSNVTALRAGRADAVAFVGLRRGGSSFGSGSGPVPWLNAGLTIGWVALWLTLVTRDLKSSGMW